MIRYMVTLVREILGLVLICFGEALQFGLEEFTVRFEGLKRAM